MKKKKLRNLSAYQSNHYFEDQENIALSGLWQQYIYVIVSNIKLEAVWKDEGQGLLNELFFSTVTPLINLEKGKLWELSLV